MIVDKALCFKWQLYGEADCEVWLSFYVKAYCTATEFLVRDIYGIQCCGYEFKDGRPSLPWTERTRMCSQFKAAFKVCYREDVCGLQDEIQDYAREKLGPKCWLEIAKTVPQVRTLDYLGPWPN